MARNELISACDRSLTEKFGALGLVRFSRGVYAQSNDDVIWRGIWVIFNIKKSILVTQPNAGVFCPVAEKLVSDGLRELHGGQSDRSYFGKLGGPVLTRPLYSLVRNFIGADRLPSAYDVASVEQIGEAAALIQNDFTRAGRRFLDPIDALPKLREQLMKDSAAGARMYAISVTYLMNKRITPDEIDEVLGPQPNAMSREFADYFKTRFASAPAS